MPRIMNRSYWNPGVLGSNVVQEASCLSQAIEKEGLQGGKGVNNEDGRPQHMHDPGIQQEPVDNALSQLRVAPRQSAPAPADTRSH